MGGGWTADRLAATGSCSRGGPRSGSPEQWRDGSAGAPSPTTAIVPSAGPPVVSECCLLTPGLCGGGDRQLGRDAGGSDDSEHEIDHDGQDHGADDHRLPRHEDPEPAVALMSAVVVRGCEFSEASSGAAASVGERAEPDIQERSEHHRHSDGDDDPPHRARFAHRLRTVALAVRASSGCLQARALIGSFSGHGLRQYLAAEAAAMFVSMGSARPMSPYQLRRLTSRTDRSRRV